MPRGRSKMSRGRWAMRRLELRRHLERWVRYPLLRLTSLLPPLWEWELKMGKMSQSRNACWTLMLGSLEITLRVISEIERRICKLVFSFAYQ